MLSLELGSVKLYHLPSSSAMRSPDWTPNFTSRHLSRARTPAPLSFASWDSSLLLLRTLNLRPRLVTIVGSVPELPHGTMPADEMKSAGDFANSPVGAPDPVLSLQANRE